MATTPVWVLVAATLAWNRCSPSPEYAVVFRLLTQTDDSKIIRCGKFLPASNLGRTVSESDLATHAIDGAGLIQTASLLF
jgi:hypothetical protein